MPKLAKRQVIILLVMVVAVIYGVYDWYARAMKKAAPIPTDARSISQALQDASALSGKNPASKAETYLIRRAEMNWPRDPFYTGDMRLASLPGDPAKAGAGAGSDKKADFRYTGYRMAGKRQLAIINGVEYETGDPLEVQGYVLKGISPSKVIIEDRHEGRVFEVFLQDFLPD